MSDAAIEVTHLVKRFGPLTAVNDVTFTVNRGECFGLIGPNGAGKTTTFSIMCGFLYPNDGQVRILGADPTSPGALKQKVGVLPQDAVLPPYAKVGELLTYWAHLSGLADPQAKAKDVLERVQLPEVWDKRAGALSHGMAKRVSMAQALMGDPPVVLLDEPTAGLDPKIAAHVRQLIHEMKGRQTIVVSSHNLQELEQLCDTAAILDRGRVMQAGTMAELTARSAEFRIQIAKGNVPVEELKLLPGITSSSYDPATGALTVLFNGRDHASEEVITATLKYLIDRDVKVLTVSRGRSLEERVLQITR
ncbi:MAG: ABC transporter ATP-binding protein [Myxococcaceae bacterium]|nr:ABC transporter ATP-binding protein [Myxococcaceae bacterium]